MTRQPKPRPDAGDPNATTAPPLDPDQQAQLEDIERETSEANAAVRDAAGWTRDNDRLVDKLLGIGADTGPDTPISVYGQVIAWNDHEAFQAETFTDAMLARGHRTTPNGEEVDGWGIPIPLPSVLAEWEIHFEPAPPFFATVVPVPREADEPLTFGVDTNIPGLVVQGDTVAEAQELALHFTRELLTERRGAAAELADFTVTVSPEAVAAERDEASATFTADQIASGATPVIQEDEAETSAAEAAEQVGAVIDPTDPIVTAQTPTAPVAVRVRELQRLIDNRFLYKTEDGFTPNYCPPYVDPADVEAWVRAGLAEWSASAGNAGGVKVTAEARSLLARSRGLDAA